VNRIEVAVVPILLSLVGVALWYVYAYEITPSVSDGKHRGVIRIGFEWASFQPCVGSQEWGLEDTSEGQLFKMYSSLIGVTESETGGTPRAVYADIEGWVGGTGRYGHMGRYSHALVVERVIFLSTVIPNDCRYEEY